MTTPAPVFDPAPERRMLDRTRRLAWGLMLPFVAIAAIFLWFAWYDDWLYGQDSGTVRHVDADVVARWFVPVPDRWWVRYRFVDAAGETHTLEESFDEPPGHDVGGRVPIVHWTSAGLGEVRMEVVVASDVFARRLNVGMAAFLILVAGGSLAVLHVRQRWRRRLLARGLRVAAEAAAVETRTLVLPKAGAVLQWRLCVRVYDAAAFAWTDVRSDWYPEPVPDLAAATLPPLLVDPADPGRRFLPAAHLVRR